MDYMTALMGLPGKTTTAFPTSSDKQAVSQGGGEFGDAVASLETELGDAILRAEQEIAALEPTKPPEAQIKSVEIRAALPEANAGAETDLPRGAEPELIKQPATRGGEVKAEASRPSRVDGETLPIRNEALAKAELQPLRADETKLTENPRMQGDQTKAGAGSPEPVLRGEPKAAPLASNPTVLRDEIETAPAQPAADENASNQKQLQTTQSGEARGAKAVETSALPVTEIKKNHAPETQIGRHEPRVRQEVLANAKSLPAEPQRDVQANAQMQGERVKESKRSVEKEPFTTREVARSDAGIASRQNQPAAQTTQAVAVAGAPAGVASAAMPSIDVVSGEILGGPLGEPLAASVSTTDGARNASFERVLAHAAAEPRAITRQIADAVVTQRDGTVELRLNPEELGRVSLSMTQVDGAMSVHLNAERPETLELLKRHIALLEAEFGDVGFDTASFSFGESGNQKASGDAQSEFAQTGPGGGDLSVLSSEDDATPVIPTAGIPPETRLDIRV